MITEFSRVRPKIIEFRPRSLDKLEAIVADGSKRSPSETQGIIRFAKNGPRGRSGSEQSRLQGSAIQARRCRNAEQLQNRRQNICRTHLFLDHFARFLFLRLLQDQRYMCCRIVEKDAVSLFPMLAQSFPMISDHDDQ